MEKRISVIEPPLWCSVCKVKTNKYKKIFFDGFEIYGCLKCGRPYGLILLENDKCSFKR